MMDKLAAEKHPDRTMSTEWTELTLPGESWPATRRCSSSRLCILFVFLTHAAEYESWSLPLAVILVIPMCLLSALAGTGDLLSRK